MMKIWFWIKSAGSLSGIVGLVSCIPPIYHTAEVSPGTTTSIGAGPTAFSYIVAEQDFGLTNVGYGGFIHASTRYAWSNRFAFVGHLGSVFTPTYTDVGIVRTDAISMIPWGGLGLQYEFIENPSISACLEAEFPNIASLIIQAGIPGKSREIATVGIKIPSSVFVTFHGTNNLHLFLGVNPMIQTGDNDNYDVSIGLGYTWDLSKIDKGGSE